MRFSRLFTVATVAVLGGCNGIFGPGACTLVGCDSGLTVRLDRVPAGTFRIEAISPEGAPSQVYDCAGAGPQCAPEAVFRDFTPSQVTIRVTTASGTVTQTFQPQYSENAPNGRECGPICRNATVTVALGS